MTTVDKEGIIAAGLRVCGFNIDNKTTEVMIQVIDHIRKDSNATMKDVLKVHKLARAHVAEEGQAEIDRHNSQRLK